MHELFTRTTSAVILAAFAMLSPPAVTTAGAALFVTTGHTGAQVQVDENHTQSWTYYVNRGVADVTGASFNMKRGSQTTELITFSLYRGTAAEVPALTPLTSITLTPSDFTQTYSDINFVLPEPVDLQPFYYYTAVLSSSAADIQSAAYFIKGGSLFFTDGSGDPITPPGGATISTVSAGQVPEPAGASLLLAGPALLLLSRRRQRGS